MSNFEFFEFTGIITNVAHAEEQGEPLHCLIKMKVLCDGTERTREQLEQDAGDIVLLTISPGPHHKISYSRLWPVPEARLDELGPASAFRRIGECTVFTFKANQLSQPEELASKSL